MSDLEYIKTSIRELDSLIYQRRAEIKELVRRKGDLIDQLVKIQELNHIGYG